MPDRMTQRLQDWGNLWRIREEGAPLQPPSILQQAQDQVAKLELAMRLHTGPKVIVAEEEMAPFLYVDKGVAASCPQATLGQSLLSASTCPMGQDAP